MNKLHIFPTKSWIREKYRKSCQLNTFVRKGVLILRPLSRTAKYLHEQENFAQGFKLLFGKSHQYTLM